MQWPVARRTVVDGAQRKIYFLISLVVKQRADILLYSHHKNDINYLLQIRVCTDDEKSYCHMHRVCINLTLEEDRRASKSISIHIYLRIQLQLQRRMSFFFIFKHISLNTQERKNVQKVHGAQPFDLFDARFAYIWNLEQHNSNHFEYKLIYARIFPKPVYLDGNLIDTWIHKRRSNSVFLLRILLHVTVSGER